MIPPPVSSLRSVALGVTDLAAAEKFFVDVWRLSVSDRGDGVVYLRAAGRDHHVVSLHRSAKTALRNITLRTGSLADLQRIEAATKAALGTIVTPIGPVPEPCGGSGL